MAVFAIKMDASDVKRGAAEAAAAMKDVAKAAEQASSSIGKATGTAKRNYDGLSEAAKAAGMFNDSLGRLHASNGRFASSSEKAAIQARAVGSNSEKAGKQVKSMGTETNSAAIALNKAATVSNELNRKLMSLAQTALTTYSAYKLLNGAVAATNVGIQANAAWESQKLSIKLSSPPRSRPGTPLKRSPNSLLVQRRLWALSRSRFSRCGQKWKLCSRGTSIRLKISSPHT